MRIKCSICDKQIIRDHVEIDDKFVTCGPVKILCCNQYACYYCGQDLDENGIFPEERGYKYNSKGEK